MDIRGFQKTTLLDYPGKVACTVFVAGCNFRCPYCYNSDLVLDSSELSEVSGDEVFSFLERRKGVLDGVVVCGGEPTLQKDLGVFLEGVKRMGFLTKLDTNGSKPRVLEDLLGKGLLDFVSLDVKAPLDERYCNAIGGSCAAEKAVLRSLKILIRSGTDFDLRTTVVPTLHRKKDLVDLAKQLAASSQQPAVLKWYLQQFQPESCLDPKLESVEPYSKSVLNGILRAVGRYVPKVELRGV